MKRLLVAAMLAAVSFEVAADASTLFSFVNPANHCTYTVSGPDITVYDCCPWGISKSGGVTESVSCP